MNCQTVSKDFNVVGIKNKGLFKDYAELVPKAAQQLLARANNIPNSTGIEISIYEPPKQQNQLEGTFYVGLLVKDAIESIPEGMEYIHIQQCYATIKGKVTEMGNLYSKLDKWIVEQGYEHETPEHYIIEVYYPVENDIEDVEVHIPIKNVV